MDVCWAHAYFEREGYFGCMPIFGEKIYFVKRPNFGREDLILECAQQMARKKHP